ncbi:cilia- and flagella-associated protein 251-like [Chelonia mydas]|uniref:cilia- and flagella-associated protein 251-like n=1 Tax=Chelonia mydas TaxID=8469 RepID=UPI001CA84CEB|nr:cilia- and flagella-associated protein 251-like [Chelonia mydas]
MLAAMPHQESSPLLRPHRLGFPSTAESKGTRPQPTQTRARAGAGMHPEDAASSGVRHRHRAANRASRRLLWRGAWEQDSTETACEKPWNRVPRLWCKEKTGGDTTVLDQGGSWCQEPCGEQAGDDRPKESQGKPRRRLNVRVRQTVGNRDRREGAQLKGERGQVPIQGVGQLEGREGHSAMGQTQKEEEEEEGLAGGLGGQEREEDEEGNEGLVGRQGDQEAGEKDEEANGGEDEEDLVERRGQEECGLAGGQRSKEEDSEEEEGLVWGQKGQEGGEDEEMEGEEGLAGGQGSEEEEGSKEEEGLPKELGGQEEAEEEEGLKQGKEEESSEEEEGLEGQQGGQEGGEEEKGSEGLVVGGTEGRVQEEEEEEDADSDLVLCALGAGAQWGPGSVEQGRGRGRETPAWNSHTPESPQDLGQDSTWEEEEEEDAESEGDEAIEAALAPQGNATEPRAKRRTSESHEWRKGRQRRPRLEEGSRKVKVVKEAPPASTTQWPRTPPRGPAARSVTGFWGDSEELGAGLETSLRKDRSLDDQDDFYD